VRSVTAVIFFLGIFAGIVAPLFRRYDKAGVVLAGGAAVLLIVAIAGLLQQDMRQGLATVEAIRREYLFVLGCESPVVVFALFPIAWLRKALFWLGWLIHLAFTAYVAMVVIWLKYSWHW
jgi:hypothetical protein